MSCVEKHIGESLPVALENLRSILLRRVSQSAATKFGFRSILDSLTGYAAVLRVVEHDDK
jgi:hypothetical protein